jgi:hypothetical protein
MIIWLNLVGGFKHVFFYHGNGMMIMMIPNDFPTWRLEATSG